LKDITETKLKLERYYASQCEHCSCDDISKCSKPNGCVCKVAAEAKAYMCSIIPHPYHKYTIWDFNGLTDSGTTLSPTVVSNAKSILLKYCWRSVTLDDLQINIYNRKDLDLDKKSIMDKRLTHGTNVLIHSPNGSQTGKTFVASIIMREAIKQRVKPGGAVQTYDWIPFVKLKHLIRKEDESISHLESCDWLVVDDIPYDSGQTRGSEAYMSSLIDPFFAERLDSGLPTIFVFKFDINDQANRWEDVFGLTISSIVKDKHSCKIKLFE
jgi:DNA replication protein DnaC